MLAWSSTAPTPGGKDRTSGRHFACMLFVWVQVYMSVALCSCSVCSSRQDKYEKNKIEFWTEKTTEGTVSKKFEEGWEERTQVDQWETDELEMNNNEDDFGPYGDLLATLGNISDNESSEQEECNDDDKKKDKQKKKKEKKDKKAKSSSHLGLEEEHMIQAF